MKKLDKNLLFGLIALATFAVFIVGFFVLSSLVQNEIIPDFTLSQQIQGVLAFVMCSPLLIAMFFAGRYFKSKGSQVSVILIFVSIALFAFGILQALLSLLGVYGS